VSDLIKADTLFWARSCAARGSGLLPSPSLLVLREVLRIRPDGGGSQGTDATLRLLLHSMSDSFHTVPAAHHVRHRRILPLCQFRDPASIRIE